MWWWRWFGFGDWGLADRGLRLRRSSWRLGAEGRGADLLAAVQRKARVGMLVALTSPTTGAWVLSRSAYPPQAPGPRLRLSPTPRRSRRPGLSRADGLMRAGAWWSRIWPCPCPGDVNPRRHDIGRVAVVAVTLAEDGGIGLVAVCVDLDH